MWRAIAVLLLAAGAVQAQDAAPAGGWVVLPVDEYRSLHDKAYPRTPEPEPEKPPVDAAFTRLEYDLRVAGDQASGEARLTVDVFKDGWVRIPIPEGLRVRAARLDGKPVVVDEAVTAQAGSSVKAAPPGILLAKPGRKSVVLDVAVPLTGTGGTEAISLPAAEAATLRASVVVPRDGLDVKLGGGLLAESVSAHGQTRWVADGLSGTALTFSWQRRVEDHRAAQPLRMRGSVMQLVGLGEDAGQITAEVKLEVVHGLASKLALAVPEGVTVNQVSGTNVGDWDVQKGILAVTFLEPVDGTEIIVVTGEARLPRDGTFGIPVLRLTGVEREMGGLAVEVVGAGEITDKQPRGLEPADPKDLSGAIAVRESPSLVAFRFRAQDGADARSLNVTVQRYTPQAVLLAVAEEARYDALIVDDGKLLVRGRYAVRNNQQSFLLVRLPEAATLWSASVSGRPVRPGRTEDGALLVPLEKARAGEEAPAFAVEIVYVQRGTPWANEGRARLSLPSVDLPVSRMGLLLYRSPRYRVASEPGTFREQAYAPPLSAALKAAESESAVNESAAAKTAGAKKRGVIGILPVQVPFPAFGEAVFFASELTKENEAPGLELRYKRTKGGRS
jgi:hypothetical protein